MSDTSTLCNKSTLSPAATQTYPVYGMIQRSLHWLIALTIFGLIGTAWLEDAAEWAGFAEDDIWRLHAQIGYALIASLAARFVWGILGPKHARWSDMWHPGTWAAAWRTRRLPHGQRVGHDPIASLTYLALYFVLAGVALTGLVLAAVELNMGPLAGALSEGSGHGPAEDIHEMGATMILGFFVIHMAGMGLYRIRHRVPVFGAMWHGRQTRKVDTASPTPSARGHKADALVGLVFLLGASLVAIPAIADEPADFLARYAAEAAKEDAGFAGFDASRGRALYSAQRVNARDRLTSCAECHSADPQAPGRTRAGKAITALSPLADPARFTDPAQVEKWFGRNCTDVLDRVCTATEKGDVLTFLLGGRP